MLLNKYICSLYRICNLEYRYKKHLEEKQPLETFKHSNNAVFCLRPKDIITFFFWNCKKPRTIYGFGKISHHHCSFRAALPIPITEAHFLVYLLWKKLFSKIWVLSVSTHQNGQKPHQEWVQSSWEVTSALGNPTISNFYTQQNGVEEQSVTPTVFNFHTDKLPTSRRMVQRDSLTQNLPGFFNKNSPNHIWVETSVQE